MKVQCYKDLIVWQKAIKLVVSTYERKTTGEYIHFLMIARGSKAELETQLHICNQLNFGKKEKSLEVESLCSEVGKMLNSMITSLAPRS